MAHRDEPNIPLALPDIGPDEEAEVIGVLRSGRLALGPKALEFERQVSAFSGFPWAVSVSSGTAGLHLAVRALGIGPEDCVVTTSFSFIASSNCLRYEGAEPVFVDIDPGTLCLSPDLLRAYLDGCKDDGEVLRDPRSGRRVAGVLPVDVFGHPADLPAILEIARAWRLPVISDTCEALGSRYRRADGTWVHAGAGAEVAVVAFYPNKQITTGEGGMVLGADPDLEERIRSLRNQGRRMGDSWLHHSRLGFNYRLDEMSAALGVAQMRRVKDILARRARVAGWYAEALAGREGVTTRSAADWAEPAWFVEALRVDEDLERDRLVEHLTAMGVEAKAYFEPPIHRQPPYAGREDLLATPLPVTEESSARTLIVPFWAAMTEAQVERVSTVLAEGVAEQRR
ncbi:MAG TPA: DegT/DnrJ/EryC1/StrS family aminotransferase [Actinomycetota bacterium]